jgi:dihydrofolate reductase
MRKILFFMATSLDGYYEGPSHELDWHNVDEEFNEFAIEQLNNVDMLLFGRVTYDMMADFWPSAYAHETDPVVANLMNTKPKIVFSKTLADAKWQNTRLVRTNFVEEVNKLKKLPGKDLIIFGSSDLAVTFLEAGLMDEIRILVNPIALGVGKSLFTGLQKRQHLELLKTRTFKSGNVLLYYKPVGKNK